LLEKGAAAWLSVQVDDLGSNLVAPVGSEFAFGRPE